MSHAFVIDGNHNDTYVHIVKYHCFNPRNNTTKRVQRVTRQPVQ